MSGCLLHRATARWSRIHWLAAIRGTLAAEVLSTEARPRCESRA